MNDYHEARALMSPLFHIAPLVCKHRQDITCFPLLFVFLLSMTMEQKTNVTKLLILRAPFLFKQKLKNLLGAWILCV
jgi:hypothetical protein